MQGDRDVRRACARRREAAFQTRWARSAHVVVGWVAGALAAAALPGCTQGVPAPPAPSAVQPAQAVEGTATPVIIVGDDFWLAARASFGNGATSSSSSTFTASLGGVALDGVTYLDEHRLSAAVPAALAPGVYELRVVDPAGREGRLAAAFTVLQRCTGAADCDDGDACNGDEVCNAAMACQPGTPPSCDDGAPCTADACDALLGCVNDASPLDGAPCEDGLFCTSNDQCFAGVCAPGAPTDCSAAGGPCSAGVCDAAAGACVATSAPDGTSCRAAAGACDVGETCVAGACPPDALAAAGMPCRAAAGPCDAAETCSGASAACPADLVLPDGAACDDGLVCTGPDACTAGACSGSGTCTDDAPPVSRFSVAPGGGLGTTVFAFDGAPSWDREDPDGALVFAWDWESDGTYDATGIGATHVFATVGLKAVTLRVTDTSGQDGFYVGWAVVDDAADRLVVDTAADVVDCCDGLTSLREAITQAVADAGPQTITFSGPMTILPGTVLPALGDAGGVLIGEPGVVIDGASLGGAADDCLHVAADAVTVMAIEVRNCPDDAIDVDGSFDWIAGCAIHDAGFVGTKMFGASDHFGPGNDVYANGDHGVELLGADALMEGNRVHDNAGIGLFSGSASTAPVVRGNVIYANVGAGISISRFVPSTTLWHNTVYANTGDGVFYGTPASGAGHDLRDNILSYNGGCGLSTSSLFTALDYNDYYANTAGSCCGCAPGGASLTVDPLFVDAATDDYRLASSSLCIDAGADTGTDVNGPARAGLYDGTAPDLGAWEAP